MNIIKEDYYKKKFVKEIEDYLLPNVPKISSFSFSKQCEKTNNAIDFNLTSTELRIYIYEKINHYPNEYQYVPRQIFSAVYKNYGEGKIFDARIKTIKQNIFFLLQVYSEY